MNSRCDVIFYEQKACTICSCRENVISTCELHEVTVFYSREKAHIEHKQREKEEESKNKKEEN